MPKTPPSAPAAQHLTASIRVVASYLHVRRPTVDTARDTVLGAAKPIAAGDTSPELDVLRLRLEKATGVPIDELARHAAAWPTA